MSDCQWERFKATAAPMASQQRQVKLCTCKLCRLSRTVANLHKRGSAAIIERQKVLAWQPEPEPEKSEDVAS